MKTTFNLQNIAQLRFIKSQLLEVKPLLNKGNIIDLGTELNNIVYLNQTSFEFMFWLIGFTDGEGTFSVEINKNSTMKTGYQVQIAYIITQHVRDLALLQQIKIYFKNSGEIKLNRGKNGGNIYQ